MVSSIMTQPEREREIQREKGKCEEDASLTRRSKEERGEKTQKRKLKRTASGRKGKKEKEYE